MQICKPDTKGMSRRHLLTAAGVAPLAMVGFSAEAKRLALTDREKANIEMVKRFLKSLEEKPLVIEELVETYFDPNASVRWMDDMPAAVGAKAVIDSAKSLMTEGATLEIQTLDVFARGPLIATSRIDIFTEPGKPAKHYPIAGVHIIKNGKFIEYTDYIFTD